MLGTRKELDMPTPALIVSVIETPLVPGSKAIALCTGDGKVFGRQLACTVSSEPDDFTRVTVTFAVDGEAIRLEE